MSPGDGPVRVLVVEDSAVQRAHLVRLLTAGGGIEVVGEAADVASAVQLTREHRPALVTMDLEIPGGDGGSLGGVQAIRRIMDELPTPILVLSVHAPDRSATPALDALDAGAIDVLPKPLTADPAEGALVRRRVRVLSGVPMMRRRAPAAPVHVPVPRSVATPVVALAASTGGPGALRAVVSRLEGISGPVLLVQHIHADFVESFARWLQETTLMPVALPQDGERAQPGIVYVAPADTHLRLGPDRTLRLDPEPDVLSRPSADELLTSVAQHAGSSAIGAVLTGMGDDGARGLLAIRRAGGLTYAQDGPTSTVDGMPRAARDIGAAEQVLPIGAIGDAIAAAAGQEHP